MSGKPMQLSSGRIAQIKILKCIFLELQNLAGQEVDNMLLHHRG